jgi:phosphoribosylanthranilate isomerase
MIIKICGITTAEDAQAAVDDGASALGFNFWPRSPRYLVPEAAPAVLASVPKSVLKVGVFVDESAETVAAVAKQLGLDVVQLHGSAQAPANLRTWRAKNVQEDFDLTQLAGGAEAYLFDAPAGDRHGGTGRRFDWGKLAGVRYKFLVAGGLDASNVGEAIEQLHPWGVDACSRLESSPGRKDHALVTAFIKQALASGKAAAPLAGVR